MAGSGESYNRVMMKEKHVDLKNPPFITNDKLIHIKYDTSQEDIRCNQSDGQMTFAFPHNTVTIISLEFENFSDPIYFKNNGTRIEVVSGIPEHDPTASTCGLHLNKGIHVIFALEKEHSNSLTNFEDERKMKETTKKIPKQMDGQIKSVVECGKQPNEKIVLKKNKDRYFIDAFQNTENIDWEHQFRVNVQFLLIGRSGNGRSATGNSIVRRKCFETSSNVGGKFSQPVIASVDKYNLKISVIDGPGFDSDLTTEEVLKFSSLLEQCLQMSKYSISGIIMTMKYGSRLTCQHTMLIDVRKSLFGKNIFLDNGICIFTHGDKFQNDTRFDSVSRRFGSVSYSSGSVSNSSGSVSNSSGCVSNGSGSVANSFDCVSKSFDEWCRRQKGETKNLFQEFNHRVLLFDNSTNDDNILEAQIFKLLSLIKPLIPFSKLDFDSCIEERNRFLEQLKLKDQVLLSEQRISSIREEYHFIKDDQVLFKKDQLARLKDCIDQIDLIEPLSPNLESEIEILKTEISTRMKCIELDLYEYGEDC